MTNTIPKRIHQMWIGDPMPAQISEWSKGWESQEGWDYTLWDEQSAYDLLSPDLRALWNRTDLLFKPAKAIRAKSNIFRIEALTEFGGIWIDTDTEPSGRSLDPLSTFSAFLVWEEAGVCSSSPWGAAKAHPHVLRCRGALDEAHETFRRRGRHPVYGKDPSGPMFVTSHIGPDVTILERSLWSSYSWRDVDQPTLGTVEFRNPHAFGEHHWMQARDRQGLALPTSALPTELELEGSLG